jgi:hypothetical protein
VHSSEVEQLPFKQLVEGSNPSAHKKILNVSSAIGSVFGLGPKGYGFKSHLTDIIIFN